VLLGECRGVAGVLGQFAAIQLKYQKEIFIPKEFRFNKSELHIFSIDFHPLSIATVAIYS
jgi:hypothetical protein